MKKQNSEELKKKIFDFIVVFIKKHGYPPAVREICAQLKIKSTSTVHKYMNLLAEDGMIEKNPTKPRALRIISQNNSDIDFNFNKEMVNIPILGKISAGQPILAVENIEDTFPLPVDFTNSTDVFILKVKGDSMIEKGIYEGDYIIVNKQNSANNGEVVVALTEEEATVKTFYKEKDYIRLQPENKSMEPIIIHGEVSILGKVVGLIRKF